MYRDIYLTPSVCIVIFILHHQYVCDIYLTPSVCIMIFIHHQYVSYTITMYRDIYLTPSVCIMIFILHHQYVSYTISMYRDIYLTSSVAMYRDTSSVCIVTPSVYIMIFINIVSSSKK